MSQQKLDLIKPFGPYIAKIKIPDDIVEKLNNYVDKIILDEEKSIKQNAGKRLVGNVTQEFQIDNEFSNSCGWNKLLHQATSKFIEVTLEKKINDFVITDTWIVRQFQNEYNPIHFHSAHISGAGFLKVPKTLGNFSQEEQKKGKYYPGGNLNLIHGSRMFLSQSSMFIKPEVGDFYFFPHYLMHLVYPFKDSTEERRSISFNAKIDEDIFNVYGE